MRYGRYLKLEKNIAASDTGGILERVRYAQALLDNRAKTHPNGRLKHGVTAELIGIAASIGVKLSDTELRYRMQAARTYDSEAKLAKISGEFANWWALIQAGFPSIEVADEPDSDESRMSRKDPMKPPTQEPLPTVDGKPVPEFSPRIRFGGDEHGPRSTIEDLYGACKESEGYTERMIANDAKRRAYVDDLASAVGGDLTKTWYEAEARMRGLGALGVTDWDSLAEIMDDIWRSARDRDRLARLDDLDPDDE